MENLSTKKCVPCQGGIPPLTEDEIKEYLPNIQGWQVLENKKIHKQFTFESFSKAIDFTNKVAKIAEEEQHHPNISIDYNKVRIDIWTHKIDGLHENDFILASKIDTI